MVTYGQLEDRISLTGDYMEKLEVVKANYPAFFHAFCKHFDHIQESMTFMRECLSLKDEVEADPMKFSLFFHGGAIQMLEYMRLTGVLTKGKNKKA